MRIEFTTEHKEVFVLDDRSRATLSADGTLYIETGDDFYDITLTPEQARDFAAWLRKYLARSK